MKFQYADAWLLLAIIYAKQNGSSTLTKIIAYGDYINHAILTLEEVQGGIYRLVRSGYVVKHGKEFIPTDNILKSYKVFSRKRNYVMDELEFMRKELNAPEWSEGYDPSQANMYGADNNITKEEFSLAYEEYFRSVKR